MLLSITVASDSDVSKIATGVHEVLEILKPLVDMLSILEKDRKVWALQSHDACAEYLQQCMDNKVRCTGNVFPLYSIKLYKFAVKALCPVIPSV